MTRGPRSAVFGPPGCGAFDPHAKATIMTAAASALLIFHLDHILRRIGLALPRDEIVLLRVVPERAERHFEQLRRLRLHASGSLERFEHEDLSDGLEMILQRDAFRREIEREI